MRQTPLRPLHQQPPQLLSGHWLIIPYLCNAYIWRKDKIEVYWRCYCTFYAWATDAGNGIVTNICKTDCAQAFAKLSEQIHACTWDHNHHLAHVHMEALGFHADLLLDMFLVQLFHTGLPRGKLCGTLETAPCMYILYICEYIFKC